MLVMVLGLLMVGCDPEQRDITDSFVLPTELKDYKVIRLYDGFQCLYVLVKNKEDREVIGASTTGKNPVRVVTIDGDEYSKVEKIKLEKE